MGLILTQRDAGSIYSTLVVQCVKLIIYSYIKYDADVFYVKFHVQYVL